MIINSSEELRNLTGSYYANNDFEKIEAILMAVEDEVATIIGRDVMASLATESKGEEATVRLETTDGETLKVANREFTLDSDGTLRLSNDYSAYGIIGRLDGDVLHLSNSRAVTSCRQAIAYMATMRFYRLNDISHENAGRKVKIDKENEARPFEWQLARDDRAHLEEYYRALDRLMEALREDPRYWLTAAYKRQSGLIVRDADSLAYLIGTDPSPWLYQRLIPYLDESQRYVAKAYGRVEGKVNSGKFAAAILDEDEELQHAAQMAVALGAIALMGRRTSLQTLPYGLMKLFESDGGGNRREQAALDRLDSYLKHLSGQQHYWLNEMKQLRDEAAGEDQPTHLQMPENDPHDKFMRL